MAMSPHRARIKELEEHLRVILDVAKSTDWRLNEGERSLAYSIGRIRGQAEMALGIPYEPMERSK